MPEQIPGQPRGSEKGPEQEGHSKRTETLSDELRAIAEKNNSHGGAEETDPSQSPDREDRNDVAMGQEAARSDNDTSETAGIEQDVNPERSNQTMEDYKKAFYEEAYYTVEEDYIAREIYGDVMRPLIDGGGDQQLILEIHDLLDTHAEAKQQMPQHDIDKASNGTDADRVNAINQLHSRTEMIKRHMQEARDFLQNKLTDNPDQMRIVSGETQAIIGRLDTDLTVGPPGYESESETASEPETSPETAQDVELKKATPNQPEITTERRPEGSGGAEQKGGSV